MQRYVCTCDGSTEHRTVTSGRRSEFTGVKLRICEAAQTFNLPSWAASDRSADSNKLKVCKTAQKTRTRSRYETLSVSHWCYSIYLYYHIYIVHNVNIITTWIVQVNISTYLFHFSFEMFSFIMNECLTGNSCWTLGWCPSTSVHSCVEVLPTCALLSLTNRLTNNKYN